MVTFVRGYYIVHQVPIHADEHDENEEAKGKQASVHKGED